MRGKSKVKKKDKGQRKEQKSLEKKTKVVIALTSLGLNKHYIFPKHGVF